MKSLILKIVRKVESHPTAIRAFHSFWQAFLGVFLVGISGVLQVHSLSDAKTAGIALISAAVAAGLSAVKSGVMASVKS